MYFLECVLILFWMFIVPALIGTLVINQLFKENKTDLLLALVCGAICMMAVFYVLVMPMLFLKIPFHVLVICWCLMILLLCSLALIYNRKRFKEILSHNIFQLKILPWLTIVVVLLIMVQAFILTYYEHEDADDSFFVAAATTTVATDEIYQFDPFTGSDSYECPSRYVMSPFPVFVALISKLVLIHPAIVAHTLLPAILIPFSYVILAVIGKKLFPDRPSAVVLFLMFLCILNLFGNVSIYTNSTFLLFRIWQGKAVLANIVLPAIFYFSLKCMNGEKVFGAWLMLFSCVLAACLTSSMGLVLAPIMIVCMGLVFAFQNRKMSTFVYSIVCCAPCIICSIVSLIR